MESNLEDRPIITVNGGSPASGVALEVRERWQKWFGEVYYPMALSLPGRTGYDRYAIVKESAEYPSVVTLVHNENIKLVQESIKNPKRTAVLEESANWVKRRVSVSIWSTRYALIKSFRSEPSATFGKEDTKIDNAPLMHLESYHLRPEDRDKYVNWLNDYGFNSFIPLLIRLPGIRGYDCYQNVGSSGLAETREWEYPEFLSCIYFEDMAAFENYTKSPELISCEKAIYNVFPKGLNLKWYVQYQLTQSRRK